MRLILTVTQDDPFPVGEYNITYTVYDQVKGEIAQIEKRITIVWGDDGGVGEGCGADGVTDNNVSNTLPPKAKKSSSNRMSNGCNIKMLHIE